MEPEKVRKKLFENEQWYPETNGCFPIALAGVFAFQYPEMSEEETIRAVKELLRPIKPGEALYTQQGKPKYIKPYDFILGIGYWTHLVHYGFGNELRFDINNRLNKLGIDLEMNFLPRNQSVEALKKLKEGATLIPTLSIYTNGKHDYFHSICFGLLEDNVYAVDGNYSLTQFDWESVNSFLTDLEYREPYSIPLTTKIGGTNAPTIYFEKKSVK